MRRLTHNLSIDVDPFIKADGRLVYAAWQRAQLSHGLEGRVSLFDINTDGADVMVLSCPMCDFVLGQRQQELAEKYSEFRPLPVLYFTQLLALALGLGPEACRFDLNYVDPRPLLEEKGLLS